MVICFVFSLLPLKQVLQLSQRKDGTPPTCFSFALEIHTCVFVSHSHTFVLERQAVKLLCLQGFLSGKVEQELL